MQEYCCTLHHGMKVLYGNNAKRVLVNPQSGSSFPDTRTGWMPRAPLTPYAGLVSGGLHDLGLMALGFWKPNWV